jgi:DNA-binding NarL/FixJ family response regulator
LAGLWSGVRINSQKIRVLIVDDHAIIREGISALINSQPDMLVAGEAIDGEEAVQQFKALQPDIAVADLNLPVICGIEAIGLIRAEFPAARFIVITALDGLDCIRQAFAAGAQAFLHKDMLRGELLSAIRAVHEGRQYIPPAIRERLKQLE